MISAQQSKRKNCELTTKNTKIEETGTYQSILQVSDEQRGYLKTKDHVVRRRVSKEKLEQLAGEYRIELIYEVELVEEEWIGKPKDLLLVLWERE